MLIAREQCPQAARIKAGLTVQHHLAGRPGGRMLRYLDEFVIDLVVERQHPDIFITEIHALDDPRDADAGGLAQFPRRFPEIKPAGLGVKIISRLHESLTGGLKLRAYVKGVREARNRSARSGRLWPRSDDKAVQYSLNLAENARLWAVGEKQSACGSRVTPPPPPER